MSVVLIVALAVVALWFAYWITRGARHLRSSRDYQRSREQAATLEGAGSHLTERR